MLWFETARSLYLQAMGLLPLSIDQPGLVKMSLNTRYLRPITCLVSHRSHEGRMRIKISFVLALSITAFTFRSAAAEKLKDYMTTKFEIEGYRSSLLVDGRLLLRERAYIAEKCENALLISPSSNSVMLSRLKRGFRDCVELWRIAPIHLSPDENFYLSRAKDLSEVIEQLDTAKFDNAKSLKPTTSLILSQFLEMHEHVSLHMVDVVESSHGWMQNVVKAYPDLERELSAKIPK